MGIGVDALEILIGLRERGYLDGRTSVVEIGAQQLANSFLEARELIEKAGDLFGAQGHYAVPDVKLSHIVHGALRHLDASAPFARDFWNWLGFEYASIDIDGSPGSIPLDLNYDSVPALELGKYQLVTNFGTTEHIANQLNAFEVIHNLTAPGGIMIHHLPMQGMFNHGLINYNPKFFWMLARSNGYKLIDSDVSFSNTYYELPDNIVDSVLAFRPEIGRRSRLRAADTMLLVLLQKTFDTPYVAPLDVATGTRTENKVLEERYWSVLKPDAWNDLRKAVPRKR